MFGDKQALGILFCPALEIKILLFAPSKKEDAGLGIFLQQKGDDFLHAFQGIDLSLVGCKRRDADPLLEALLGADGCWQQVQVATLFREDTVELADVDRIAQTFENLGVALKGRG